jgi:hypothetical protein
MMVLQAAEQVMQHIAAKHPDYDGLFFVGGVWGKGGFWCVYNTEGYMYDLSALSSSDISPCVYIYTERYMYDLSALSSSDISPCIAL